MSTGCASTHKWIVNNQNVLSQYLDTASKSMIPNYTLKMDLDAETIDTCILEE